MFDVLLIASVLGAGFWIGWVAREEKLSPLKLLAASFGFFAAALVFYGWQCDAASIPDILLFRDVPGQFFCSGRLTLLGYMCLLAIPASLMRNYLQKYIR
jgi:hypothetical protein